MAWPIVSLMLLTSQLMPFASSMTVYIRTELDSQLVDCPPNEQCLTLSEVARNQSLISFQDSLTLSFLQGNHNLSEPLMFENIATLVLAPSTDSSNGTATITCSNATSYIAYRNTGQLQVRGLSFNGCETRAMFVDQVLLEDTLFDGQDAKETSLDLEAVGEARINNCTFRSNIKDTSNEERLLLFIQALSSGCVEFNILLDHIGGALTAINSDISIEDSQFSSNAARVGGAMYIASSNMSIKNCEFNSNVASNVGIDSIIGITDEESTGGAIHAIGSNVEIEASTFDNNTASGNGGAIYTDGHLVIANGSSFSNNKAREDGGAVFSHHGTVIIENNNSFILNSAGTSGGAIKSRDILIIRNSNSFSNNTAQGDGGTLFSTGILEVIDSNLFFNSITNASGAAIFDNGKQITITNSNVFQANVARRNGGAMYTASSVANISDSNRFVDNVAMIDGGALWTQFGDITIQDNVSFVNNTAQSNGGALWVRDSHLFIRNENLFQGCRATTDGGALWMQYSDVLITAHNEFSSNFANNDGGAIYDQYGNITVNDSNVFNLNTAGDDGGALFADDGDLIEFANGNVFSNNLAEDDGGAFMLRDITSLTFAGNEFNNNTADAEGGAVRILRSLVTFSGNNSFSRNQAEDGSALYLRGPKFALSSVAGSFTSLSENRVTDKGIVYTEDSMIDFTGDFEMRDNIGSFFLDSSSFAHFSGQSSFINNSYNPETGDGGGSVTVNDKSRLSFFGSARFLNNRASMGGAIVVTSGSEIHFHGNISFEHNRANSNGGGIYIMESKLFASKFVRFDRNNATNSGGGVYGSRSMITLENGLLHFTRNEAEGGGGIYLDHNTSIFITDSENKTSSEKVMPLNTQPPQLKFTDNIAHHGGGIFVDDIRTAACRNSAKINKPLHQLETDCFFQISLQEGLNENEMYFYFSNNSAKKGSAIYGGLLDRCRVRLSDDEGVRLDIHSMDFFQKVSNLNDMSLREQLSSDPVRVCLCRDAILDCNYQLPPSHTIGINGVFSVFAAAVDQVNNSVPATIYSSLVPLKDGPVETQLSQNTTDTGCTNLEFEISPNYESLQLSPCSTGGISQQNIQLNFETCSEYCSRYIGLQARGNTSTCQCKCSPDLPYVHTCVATGDSGVLVKEDDYWLDVIHGPEEEEEVEEEHHHDEDVFISLQFCPYDYCLPLDPTDPLQLDLNLDNGSDAQCAFNRTGVACGSCKDGLSLVFGSSRCEKCSNVYLLLIIPFGIAGILIVAIIMICNLTVAVGTMNGAIFFANIVVANRSVFFPFGVTNTLTVFISWLSLSFGIESCFYDGMDPYGKVLFQFLFDFYLIIIVIVILLAAHYSLRVSNFLSTKNPVATLATLILYTFEKSLRKLSSLMSYATLSYSTGKKEIVWLFDPNERYLRGPHIFLAILFFTISLLSLVFIFFLIFGHFLIHLPKRRPFKFFHHPKFLALLDAYQAPYNPRHRYWVGILLLLRVVLYISLEFNAAGDTRTSLIIITFIGISILAYKLLVGGVYRGRWKDNLETYFVFNLIMLTLWILYGREVRLNLSYIFHAWSGFVCLGVLGILVYHTYRYVLNGTTIQQCMDKFLKKMKEALLKRCSYFAKWIAGDNTENNFAERRRNFDVSLLSFPNTLQRPLNPLFDREPSTSEYILAEGPGLAQSGTSSVIGRKTSAVVDISRDSLPLSRILGHDTSETLVDPASPPPATEVSPSEDLSTNNTRSTGESAASTNLSSEQLLFE